MLVPLVFVIALAIADGRAERRAARPLRPRHGARGRRSSSCCFGSIWLFPLITALVAGDIVASEDRNGTLKTILTRSLDRAGVRRQGARRVTYTVTLVLAIGVVGLIAGSIAWGFNELQRDLQLPRRPTATWRPGHARACCC